MTIDIRAAAARYYDMNSDVPKDLEFYHDRIQSPDSTVLELGCGTGRVLVPLVEDCAHIHGIDVSSAMLSICQDKLRESRIPIERAHLEIGDITEINLGKTFDLITAPFRVFQNLETDVEIDRFFETVRNHLSPGATCILNVFKPKREAVDLCQDWVKKGEYPCWETRVEGERVNCHGRNARIDQEKMVLYP